MAPAVPYRHLPRADSSLAEASSLVASASSSLHPQQSSAEAAPSHLSSSTIVASTSLSTSEFAPSATDAPVNGTIVAVSKDQPVDSTAIAVVAVLLTVAALFLFLLFTIILPYLRRRREREGEPVTASIAGAFAKSPLGRSVSAIRNTSARIVGKEPPLKDRRIRDNRNPPKFPPPLQLNHPRESYYDASAYYYRSDELGDYHVDVKSPVEDGPNRPRTPDAEYRAKRHEPVAFSRSAPPAVHAGSGSEPSLSSPAGSEYSESVYSQSEGLSTGSLHDVNLTSRPDVYPPTVPLTPTRLPDSGRLQPASSSLNPTPALHSAGLHDHSDPKVVQLLRMRARGTPTTPPLPPTSAHVRSAAAPPLSPQSPPLHQVSRIQRQDSVTTSNEEYYLGHSNRRNKQSATPMETLNETYESELDSPNSVIVLSPSPPHSRIFTDPPRFTSPPHSPNLR